MASPSGCTRSRLLTVAHGSTSSAHDACTSLDLAGCVAEATCCTGCRMVRANVMRQLFQSTGLLSKCGAHADPSCNLLAGSGSTLVGMAHTCGVCARVAISKCGTGLSKHRFLQPGFFSGGQLFSHCRTPRNGQNRRSFCISFWLPCRATSFPDFLVFCDRVVYPVLFVFTAIVWPVCSGRPAMRRCVDVDLRHRRLLDCRDNCRGAFTLALIESEEQSILQFESERSAIRNGPAADGGCLNVQPVHSYRATRVFQSRKTGVLRDPRSQITGH